MVNHLQDLKLANIVVSESTIQAFNHRFETMFSLLKSGKFYEHMKSVIESGVSCKEYNNYLFDGIVTNKFNLTIQQTMGLIQILARNERDFKLGADETIIFIASTQDIIKCIGVMG